MRFSKRLFSLFLALVMIAGVFGGLQIPANAAAQDCITTLEAINNFDLSAFTQTLEQGLSQCSDIVEIINYRIPSNTKNRDAISYYIRYYMPEYFHINTIQFVAASSFYYQIRFTYDSRFNSAATYAAARRVFDSEMTKLSDGIVGNNLLSDEQIALLLHDRIIAYLDYDEGVLNGTQSDDSYTLAGVVFNQTAVCDGYCRAYYYLLKQAGITSLIVTSNAMGHAWNIVFVDGVPYYTDCTWDDPLYTYKGYVRHKFFLRSLQAFLTDEVEEERHCGENGVVDYTTDLEVNSTKYDTYFWQKSTAEFQLINNEIYYFDNEKGTLRKAYVPLEGATYDTGLVFKLPDYWYPNENEYYTDYFSKLVSDGKTLFFNGPKEIFKYNVNTGACTVLFEPHHNYGPYYNIYGLALKDGVFTYEIGNDANYEPGFTYKYTHTREYKSFTLSAEFDASKGTVSGTGDYSERETVTLKATPYPGNYVKEFLCGGVAYQTENNPNEITVEITGDMHFYVGFETCEHPQLWQEEIDPTCTQAGYSRAWCSRCGYEKITIKDPALGHIWSEWSTTTPPACNAQGEEMRTCARDTAHVETRSIEPLPHTPANTTHKANETAPTCTEDGSYDIVRDCLVCGEIAESEHFTVPKLGHDWGPWETSVVATCAAEGKEVRICANDHSHVLSRNVGKLSHVAGEEHRENEIAATCSMEGHFNLVVRCINCKTVLSETAQTTEKLPHSWVSAGKVAAKAYELGYTLHKCKVCDALMKTDFTAPTGKVKNLKCKTRGTTTETITWDRVAGAAGYEFGVSTKDGKKMNRSGDAGIANVVNVTGLAVGAPYKFYVRFYMKDANGEIHYAPWTTFSSPTNPKGTTISKLSGSRGGFTATWKKNSAVTGYQVQYSLKSNYASSKILIVKSPKLLKATIKKLSAKKTYYVRIRTYKTMNKINYYSAWSKTYKVKTK